MKRRLLCLLLAVVLLCSVFPYSVAAEEIREESGLYYTVENGEATLVGSNWQEPVLELPTTLGGYPLTTVAREAIISDVIEIFIIPEGIKHIEGEAIESKIRADLYLESLEIDISSHSFLGMGRIFAHLDRENKQQFDYPGWHILEEYPCDPRLLTEQQEGAYTYAVYEGEAIVLSCTKDAISRQPHPQTGELVDTLEIPDTLGGYPVTELASFFASRSFNQKFGMVILPEGLRKIYYKAIPAGSNVISKLPDSLEYIGDYNFVRYRILDSTMPENLRYLGDFAFDSCEFDRLVFGEKLEYLGDLAFRRAQIASAEVTLPASLRYMGQYCFEKGYLAGGYGKGNMELTILSRDVECAWAFENALYVQAYSDSTAAKECRSQGIELRLLDSGEVVNNAYEVEVDGIRYRVTEDHCEIIGSDYEKIPKDVFLPEEVEGKPVTVLGRRAFQHPCKVETVWLPNTMETIRSGAFSDCRDLYFVYMPDGIRRIENEAFELTPNLRMVYLSRNFTDYVSFGEIYEYWIFDRGRLPERSVVAHPDTPAYRRGVMQSCCMAEAREGEYMYLADNRGIYATDGSTAICIAMIDTPEVSYYDPYKFSDEIYGIPVTTIAGSLAYPRFDPPNFGYEVAVLGDNITVVEEGAFSRSDLRYIYFGRNVKELPYPLISEENKKGGHAICGYAGSYVEEYCKQYGYSFYPVDSAPFEDVSLKDWFNDAVSYCYWAGLMSGVSKDRFAPNAVTNRAMVAQVLYNLSGKPYIYEWEYGFKDVHEEDWFCDAVNWCSYYGITKGTDKYHFSPKDPVTREQLVTLFYRYGQACKLDLTERAKLDAFKDRNSVSAYAQEAMQWAVGAGIIYGRSASTLAPKGHATRAEIAAILMRFVEYVEALGA